MNQLYYGDNLQVLREHVTKESVDLNYLDPPFDSKRDGNLLQVTETAGRRDSRRSLSRRETAR